MFLTLEDSHNIFVSEEIRLHNNTHRMITILFKKKRDVCHVCVSERQKDWDSFGSFRQYPEEIAVFNSQHVNTCTFK